MEDSPAGSSKSRSRSTSFSGSRETLVTSYENNISMLMEKLKELRMSAENLNESAVYSKVERK